MFFSVRNNPALHNLLVGISAATYLLWILHAGHQTLGTQPKVLFFTLFIVFFAQSLSSRVPILKKKSAIFLQLILISTLAFVNSSVLFVLLTFAAGLLTPILPTKRVQVAVGCLTGLGLIWFSPLYWLVILYATAFISGKREQSTFGEYGFTSVFLPTVFLAWNWLSIRYHIEPSMNGSLDYAIGAFLGASLLYLPLSTRLKRFLLLPWLLFVLYVMLRLEEWIRPDFNLESYKPIGTLSLGLAFGGSCIFLAPKKINKSVYLALSVGLATVLLAENSTTLIWLAIAVCSLVMIWNQKGAVNIVYAFLIALLVYAFLPLGAHERNRNNARHYTGIQLTVNQETNWGFGNTGAFSVDVEKDEMSLFVNKPQKMTITLDGSTISNNGRAASSERFFGTYAGLLSTNPSRIVLSGDHVANILSSLRKEQTLKDAEVHLIFPNKPMVNAIAKQSPTATAYWLGTNTNTHYAHRRAALSSLESVDLFLDVIHSPWGDSDSPVLNDDYYRKVKKTLSTQGVYGVLVHLRNWNEHLPALAIKRAAKYFDQVQVCLPETGIDSVLFFGSDKPFSFDDFKNKHENEKQAIMAASHCVGGHELISKWSADKKPSKSFVNQTPSRQLLHLTEWQEIFDSPQQLWSELESVSASKIEKYHQDKATTLQIYKSAAGGNIEDVFNNISKLRDEAQNPSAMWPLIKRHVLNARDEIKLARKEGVISKHWQEAKRFALTAQMISPKSIEPQLLLGEIAIAESNLDLALKHFEQAYSIDPLSLSAINGFTRVYGLKNDTVNIEMWLNKGVEAYPRDARSHLNLGVYLKNQKRYSEAEDHLQRAASIADGRVPNASLALTDLYLELEQPTRALVEIERQIRIKPSAFAWFLRGRAYFDLKQYDNAEKDFRRAILKDPNLHQARGEVGLVRIAKGDLEGAAQAFRATLQFDPSNNVAKQNLVQVEKEINARKALKVQPAP